MIEIVRKSWDEAEVIADPVRDKELTEPSIRKVRRGVLHMIQSPFTHQELLTAYQDWGCNCGPSALAFALQTTLANARYALPGFDAKGFTSPTMMRDGIERLGKTLTECGATIPNMFDHRIAVVRIQWTGPWTQPGMNKKWAYRQTHWIAAWEEMREQGREGAMAISRMVYDCNGGVCLFEHWVMTVVPQILTNYPRADGGWLPTHVWRINP